MTIGIAAKSKEHECIVTVSDRRISFEDDVPSLDNAINKDWFIAKNWGALFATNDASYALPIIKRTNHLLVERGGNEGLEDVRTAICDAYVEIRREHVTREFLSSYGFVNIDQFRKEGVSNLGRKLFWSLSRKIEGESLAGTTFLVYGYDENTNNTAHLFEVKNPGNSFLLDHMQYFAIGSGVNIVMASLNLRPVNHLNPAQLIYRVCEAKFAAETTSSGVGRSTTVLIANRGEPTTFLTGRTIERIRALWESSLIALPPNEINDLIISTPRITPDR